MKNEAIYDKLSEEVKQKLAECKTQEELRGVLAEAGVDPLDEALLNAVAGGMRDPFFPHLVDVHKKI